MSNFDNILEEISKKEFNKLKYVDSVIKDEGLRDFIVENMINHPKIMKYYHCFYIIADASELKPELFYNYWDKFVDLLNHSNSYHRDFGLILLANIVRIDDKNKFNEIIDDYLEHLNDEKFMTAEVCIKNSAKVALAKPELLEKIINRLLNLESYSKYPEKQKAVMMSNIIQVFENIIDIYSNKSLLIDFAKKHLSSISPKTRKVAKKFISDYN